MNIFSSPLDLYLANAHKMNAQKNTASLLSSASYLSQLNSMNQQKIYSSLLNARQHQAEHLDDPSLYTNDPIKKLKPNNAPSNFTGAPNPYFQEAQSANREYLNKLSLNHSRVPTTESFGPLKNNQPYQQAAPGQYAQQKVGSVIDLESDDEDCVIVEKPNLNQPPIPVQNFQRVNYHPLPDLVSHNYFNGFKAGHFNRPQFNAPVPNNMWAHQNALYPQNVKLEQSPADFSHQRPVNVMGNLNNHLNNQQGRKAIMIEEEENSDDFSNSTTDTKSLTLPPQNNYLMQMHMLNNYNKNRFMSFNSQFESIKPIWEQTGGFPLMNSNSSQNPLKVNIKLPAPVKEVKEKKKPKNKPRSPKKRVAEKPLIEAEIKSEEPYIIELHIDPNDPSPNVCDTMVGDEFQASVPSLVLNKRIETEKREIKSKWNPDNVEREKLLEYFDTLEKKTEIEITNEIAKIKLLKENNLDIEKSLDEVDRNLVYFKGVLKLTKRRGRRSK